MPAMELGTNSVRYCMQLRKNKYQIKVESIHTTADDQTYYVFCIDDNAF